MYAVVYLMGRRQMYKQFSDTTCYRVHDVAQIHTADGPFFLLLSFQPEIEIVHV